jgi:protein-tyrosine-phosphatase
MSVILFVCTGNLCRSPMATGLLRKRLAEKDLEARHRVVSAGVWAMDGEPASAHAVTVMAERGIDISDHIAHTLTADDVSEADLILVMGREHERMIRNTWPQYSWKIHRLSEMAGKRQDIQDPYRGPIEEYRASADTIANYIDRGLERILELVR